VSELAQAFPWLVPVGGGILGLLVGSFINVVVYRLPIMMEIAWRKETNSASDSGIEVPAHIDADRFSLWRPASTCPHCNTPIAAYRNVPIVSFLLLGGRCGSCREPISARYPLVEAFVGIVSAIVAWRFGFSWQCLAALGLTWTLTAASLIDIDHYLLPDSLTLPLMWAGLLLAAIPDAGAGLFVDLRSSVIGAAAGYLSLWSVAKLFWLVTGKDGMGHGDFKLLAALGAWLGWQMLPLIITLSAAIGSVLGIAAITVLRRSKQQPLPFGPYLAIAGWVALLWGESLIARYLDLIL
jgi:leader peptidase (prepilin peptidase)/N-methyltransferase